MTTGALEEDKVTATTEEDGVTALEEGVTAAAAVEDSSGQ